MEILVVYICNAKPALFEQKPFTALVIIKILVLVRTDVVLAQISEDPDLKRNPRCPMKHQSLG